MMMMMMIIIIYKYLFGLSNRDEMGGVCSMYEGEERCIQGCGRET